MSFTVSSFIEAKQKKQKITMLTAYDYAMARIIDESGIDSILIGDSLAMTIQGRDSTLSVTLDEMIYHSKCVSKGVRNALVICDMPFLTYHISIEEAVRNAGRCIQEGNSTAVKLEGGVTMAETVKAIVRAQIPVLGHIGLTPQSVNVFGGFKVQGRDESRAKQLIDDAIALEQAGVFGIVLEAVPEALAKIITEKVSVPTVGIGAGKYCDGQVLVVHDAFGMYSDFTPKFVKKYADIKNVMSAAVGEYISDVKTQAFPEEKHTFSIDESVMEKIRQY